MAKFKVGDKVEIKKKKEYITVSKGYAGESGVIGELDYNEYNKWVRVHFNENLHLWFISSEVKHVTN